MVTQAILDRWATWLDKAKKWTRFWALVWRVNPWSTSADSQYTPRHLHGCNLTRSALNVILQIGSWKWNLMRWSGSWAWVPVSYERRIHTIAPTSHKLVMASLHFLTDAELMHQRLQDLQLLQRMISNKALLQETQTNFWNHGHSMNGSSSAHNVQPIWVRTSTVILPMSFYVDPFLEEWDHWFQCSQW